MSFGYCQTYNDQLDPSSADTRYLIGSGSLPSSIRLLGFSFFHSIGPVSDSADRFKLFDGTSSSSVIWTFPMLRSFWTVGGDAWSTNQNSMLMTDDSFLKINDGLAYEVTSTDFSSSSYKINVTVFYC
jgi:hypothetical protein